MFHESILDILPLEILLIGSALTVGLIIGLLVERWLYPKLNKGAARSRRTNFRILLRSLKGETLIWFIIMSIYTLVVFLPLDQTYKDIIFDSLIVILIVSVAWFIGNLLLSFITYYTRKGSLPKTTIFTNLTKLSVFLVTAIIVLNIFGISVSPILAALGVGGIAIALALQDTLANLFAGISILTARQINPGDYVKLASGEEGFVEDVSWRNTTIRSLENAMVIIPNKNLGSLIVTNYSLPVTELNLKIPVGVSYQSDLNDVEAISIEVAMEVLSEVDGGVSNFEPFVRFREFGESSINFFVIIRIRSFADIRLIRSEFIKRLHTKFNSKNINIPFPIRTVYLKNETLTNVDNLEHKEKKAFQ